METLGTSGTLLKGLGFPQTVEPPGESLDSPPPIRSNRREPRDRASRLGFLPKSPDAKSRDRRVSRASARLTGELEAETPVPGEVELAGELGLGLPPNGSSAKKPFEAGNLVWVKIKNQPWWPGRVCDPSQSSDGTIKADRQIFVAFFGGNTFSWCRPDQLKPFNEEFKQMVKQSGSKSFVGAVKDSLDWIRGCLESEMTCYCVPSESQAQIGRAHITNYSQAEFLDHLRVAACDVSVTDVLEATMLRAWVLAFFAGKDGSSSHGYMLELVDQEGDLNAPPLKEYITEKPEEERWVTGIRAVKGPEISEGESSQRKKKSMAELIGVVDVGMVEPDTGKEEKAIGPNKKPDLISSGKHRRGKSYNDSAVEIGAVVAEGGNGSSRRERKKSKYLSPPYTYSVHSECLDSPTDAKLVMTKKDLEALGEVIHKEEDEMNPCLFEYAGTPSNEILSQFLSTAINPLHLNRSRSAKIITGFFAKFRSLVCSGDLELETYQKRLGGSGSVDGEFLYTEWKAGANGEGALNLGHGATRELGKAKQGRKKMRMDQVATGGTPMNLPHNIADGSEGKSGRKRRESWDGANGGIGVDLGHTLISSEKRKLRQRMNRRSNGGGNVETSGAPVDFNHEISDCSRLDNSGRRGKKSKDGVPDGSEEGRSRQKRKKREVTISAQPVASPPLPYIRENLERMISTLAGSPLPKKDAAPADGLKPDVRENLVGEMKGLLNKVNKLLT